MNIRRFAILSLVVAVGVYSARLIAQDEENPANTSSERRREERVFTVEHATMESVANKLKDLFEGDENKWMLQTTDKRIRVSGSQEQLEAAADLISTLERNAASNARAPNVEKPEHYFQVFALGGTSADTLAQTLKQIYLDDIALRVEADVDHNRLLVLRDAGTYERNRQDSWAARTIGATGTQGADVFAGKPNEFARSRAAL